MGLVQTRVDDGLVQVTLDRPEHRNAVNLSMMRQMTDVLSEAERQQCRLVLIGAVGEDFAIGRDHGESPLAEPPGSSRAEWIGTAGRFFQALDGFSGISVVSARGITFGFGCALATVADICIASRNGRFAFDEVAKGFPPKLVMGGVFGRISTRALIDLVVTGRVIDAEEAHLVGIVSQVAEDHLLDQATNSMVETIMRNDQEAVRESKRFIKELVGMDPGKRSGDSLIQRALS